VISVSGRVRAFGFFLVARVSASESVPIGAHAVAERVNRGAVHELHDVAQLVARELPLQFAPLLLLLPPRTREQSPQHPPVPFLLELPQLRKRRANAQQARIGRVYPVAQRAPQRARRIGVPAANKEALEALVPHALRPVPAPHKVEGHPRRDEEPQLRPEIREAGPRDAIYPWRPGDVQVPPFRGGRRLGCCDDRFGEAEKVDLHLSLSSAPAHGMRRETQRHQL